jgi:hypothetical protein
MKMKILLATVAAMACASVPAQVNSGSNGSDGAFNPATNTVINMADHPNGIYQFTTVTISNGITVTFIPNANNSPVTWLVQGDCVINGTVDVSGQNGSSVIGSAGGPGGWRGGNGALSTTSLPGAGLGPGGGTVGSDITFYGGNASFGTMGDWNTNSGTYRNCTPQFSPGSIYGNSFNLPLLGGSGGSGGRDFGGGGGGGAILIAASGNLIVSGSILARGGGGGYWYFIQYYGNYWSGTAGAGSGGAIRLVATTISGSGSLDTSGGQAYYGSWNNNYSTAWDIDSGGTGRIRLDGLNIVFNGSTTGVKTSGFQPVIVPAQNQLSSLLITSIAGVTVAANPSGVLITPDAVISGNQSNPIPVVVNCSNLPLNTPINVTVKPASGAAVSAVGYNSTGTLASSTATVSIVMPRGGGIIYATAATSN